MRFGNLALIRILLQEYVDIVQTSGSSLIEQTSLNKSTVGSSSTADHFDFGYESDDEDQDDALAEIEDEILLLVAHQSGNKKRQRGIDISQNKTRKKIVKTVGKHYGRILKLKNVNTTHGAILDGTRIMSSILVLKMIIGVSLSATASELAMMDFCS